MTSTPRPKSVADSLIVKVTPELLLTAAAALVGRGRADGAGAGRRFLNAAKSHGIDLRHMWASLRPGQEGVGQVCLAVPGAGRTCTMFTSTPANSAEVAELSGVIDRACATWTSPALAQALLEPQEVNAAGAFDSAAFARLATLGYLTRPLEKSDVRSEPASWPDGVSVKPFGDVPANDLIDALDRSYVDTLDCPALCDLRETTDVIESHRATGVFDPALWWLIYARSGAGAQRPEGAMLFNRSPALGHVELVYLGLSPAVRGIGLGRMALAYGLSEVARRCAPGLKSVTCAVDRLNTPALRLYQRAGFQSFTERIAMVRRIGREGSR